MSQALAAQVMKQKNYDKAKSWKNKEKGKYAKNGVGNSGYKKDSNFDHDHGDSSSKKGSGGHHRKEEKKKFDRKKIKCFNCQKFGHFANEWKFDQKRGDGDEAHMAQEDSSFDSDPILLMTTSYADPPEISNSWYLDTGCSNHMTCRREWLPNLDPSKRFKVRFVDHRTVTTERIGTVAIRRTDGQLALIQEVLYVPDMKCNLLSLGQLVEKGFTVLMKDDCLKMFDSDQNLMLKAPLANNGIFQVDI